MKRCPSCEEIYSHDSLRFCRNDGAELMFVTSEDKQTLIKLPALAGAAPTTETLSQPPTLPKLSQLTFAEAIEEYPAWSPNGEELAFSREEAGIRSLFVKNSRAGTADIWCVDVESGELKRLTKSDSVDVNPFFSPDGEMIAYNSDQSGRPEPWVMNADGSNPRQLAGVGLVGHFMQWQPKGDALIFRCPAGGRPASMKVRLDGSDPEPLPEVAGGAHMSFSPDRSRIMDVIGHKALWVSPLDGGKPEKVFEFDDPDVRIDYPVWSPDGHWVLFDRFRPQGGDIWMMEHFE
jgi:Tol biopolymer transport system component